MLLRLSTCAYWQVKAAERERQKPDNKGLRRGFQDGERWQLAPSVSNLKLQVRENHELDEMAP